jgi:hypothetical protein
MAGAGIAGATGELVADPVREVLGRLIGGQPDIDHHGHRGRAGDLRGGDDESGQFTAAVGRRRTG